MCMPEQGTSNLFGEANTLVINLVLNVRQSQHIIFLLILNETSFLQNIPVCGKPRIKPSSIQPKIAQGRAVSKGALPWITMLSKTGIPFCGGSLIGQKWIITAAHCLHPPYDPDNPNLSNFQHINVTSFKVILDDMVIVSGWGKQFLHSIPETLMEEEEIDVFSFAGWMLLLYCPNTIL
ncbi:transmembrane protease serine 11G-like isoform X2 [Rhincodon typus]|uniref:transmembrane protease serine 11G-like isoform X2 n=1 Tax=Rhincodon typus TaxID=259920 RepID=UPI0020303CFD|nr:transmembrane protease serine 11G-like isoform X2 [Rhincodon typus]